MVVKGIKDSGEERDKRIEDRDEKYQKNEEER